jgi:hypothetical protein
MKGETLQYVKIRLQYNVTRLFFMILYIKQNLIFILNCLTFMYSFFNISSNIKSEIVYETLNANYLCGEVYAEKNSTIKLRYYWVY